ncbi:hypothetical protein [Altericroceibacterium xinjiangense]|uniref:hypothetical protein n=1 Tax=Altericroceibacterium xinjiangense TaxID=762261 RepID=UPI000F7E23BA|nr:hypothetical protein [Altericroceibacterium xinjiangense]
MPTFWLLLVAIGPLLLIAAIYFGFFRNRDANRRQVIRAERGAKEFREDIAHDPEYHPEQRED